MTLVGEHYEHGDEDNVPQPPERFQTSSRSVSEFHWNLEKKCCHVSLNNSIHL